MGDITDSMDMNLGKLWEMVRDRESWHAIVQGIFLTQGLNLDLPHCVKPMIFSIRSLVYLA